MFKKRKLLRGGMAVLILFIILCWAGPTSRAETTTVCTVNGKPCDSFNTALSEAVRMSQENSERKALVEVNADCDLLYNENIHLGDFTTGDAFELNEEIEITLDLKGHKVAYKAIYSTSPPMLPIAKNCSFILKDSVGGGELYSQSGTHTMVCVYYGGKFTMESGTIRTMVGPGVDENPFILKSGTGIYQIYGGIVIINGGSVYAGRPLHIRGPYGDIPYQIQINGGLFQGVGASIINTSSPVSINGGSFISTYNKKVKDNICCALRLLYYKEPPLLAVRINGGTFKALDAGIAFFEIEDSSLEWFSTALLPQCMTNGYNLYGSNNRVASLAKTMVVNPPDNDYTYNTYEYLTYTPSYVRATKGGMVKIVANGGVVNQSKVSIGYNGGFASLPVPKKTGYIFTGWYSKILGGQKITSSTRYTAQSPQMLYAHWEPIRVTLSFDANRGTKLVKKAITAIYGKKIASLPSVQRRSYQFIGWYTKKVGGTKVTASTVSKYINKATLYARWSKVTVKKTSITSLKSKSKKLSIKWKAISGAKGYQISLSTYTSFKKGVKTYQVTGKSKTITKLKKGKRYYIRVRAFTYDSTKSKVYGTWSKTRYIRIR